MWVKVDDKIHNHRKTRKAIASGKPKRRDAAPMGLWLLAAAWAGQNVTDGWVPADELDRWDDDCDALADRLVKAGYWWPEDRDGEPGFGFVNWNEYNPAAGASSDGSYGNHVRWHVARGKVSPDCPLCPKEPPPDSEDASGGIAPRLAPDSEPDSGGGIAPDSEIIAQPEPEPEPDASGCDPALHQSVTRASDDSTATASRPARPGLDAMQEVGR